MNLKEKFLNIESNDLLDKILATTSSAVKRRKVILEILENEGEKDTADIIDALKRLEGYKGLDKKTHLTEIKNDMDAILNLGFEEEHNRKYFLFALNVIFCAILYSLLIFLKHLLYLLYLFHLHSLIFQALFFFFLLH